jgi:hypothetical protein
MEIGRAAIARSATIRSGTGRSASHEPHTRAVSPEAGLVRAEEPTAGYVSRLVFAAVFMVAPGHANSAHLAQQRQC